MANERLDRGATAGRARTLAVDPGEETAVNCPQPMGTGDQRGFAAGGAARRRWWAALALVSVAACGREAMEARADAAARPDAVAACLSDGSGRLALQTSGGLTLSVQQGNDVQCVGLAGAMSNVQLDWVIDDAASGARISFNMDIPSFPRGQAASGRALSLSVLAGAPIGNICDASNCTLDITENTLAEMVAGETRYKLSGAVHCPSPIPGVKPGALSIGRFEFTTRVVY